MIQVKVIYRHRQVSPEKGQESLEKIHAFAKIPGNLDPLSTILKVPGENVSESSFPKWIDQILSNLGFRIDRLNYCWFKETGKDEDTEDHAQAIIVPAGKALFEAVKTQEMADELSHVDFVCDEVPIEVKEQKYTGY